jgi:hypothetical protein
MRPSRTLSVSIARRPSEVYAYVSDPRNLSVWAAGLCTSIVKSGDTWIAQTPQGPATLRFAGENDMGVLDHYVNVAGAEIYVPIRVLANESGSELILTLFRLPQMTDEKFSEDTALVERDLATLKKVLER